MYRDYLEFAGFQVETARDGHEALTKARASNPDLVLMDLSLPGLDGWEATRLLKTDPATSHLTVVALSAHALPPKAIAQNGPAATGSSPSPASRTNSSSRWQPT